MTAAMPWSDFAQARRRTRWTMSASVVIHMLLMLWVVSYKTVEDHLPEIEILMIDPAALMAPSAGSPAPAAGGHTASGVVRGGKVDERFPRFQREADFVPAPQSRTALEDRLAAQVASLERRDVAPIAGTAAAGIPSGAWSPATAGAGAGSGAGPIALKRGGAGGTGPALQLTRGSGAGIGPAVVPTANPVPGSGASAPARGGESTARRHLAGATLMGPIADRPVVTYATPTYPEWAKREAVEGSVTLYFVVRPDGSVKENVLVQKTAGFEDFDENARQALRAWKFQALTGGRTGEQWGTITFHFRLREAN